MGVLPLFAALEDAENGLSRRFNLFHGNTGTPGTLVAYFV